MQFNQNQWNTGLWGTDGTIAPAYSTDLVVFEGFSLSDNVNIICQNLIDSAAEREILEGNVPRGNGMYVNGDYWRKKPIEVVGSIKIIPPLTYDNSEPYDTADYFYDGEHRVRLDPFLDVIRKNLRQREGILDITRKNSAGDVVSVRRYAATWVNPQETFAERNGQHISFCPFNVKFDCHYPFGRDREYTVTNLTLTASPTTQAVYHYGTVDAAEPIISLIFDSASSVTAVNIMRVDSDGNTLDEIEYSGSIAANDYLIFDSENKEVKKNGTAVDYTGAFPLLAVGNNLLKITVTGTSFNAITTIRHRNTYL